MTNLKLKEGDLFYDKDGNEYTIYAVICDTFVYVKDKQNKLYALKSTGEIEPAVKIIN